MIRFGIVGPEKDRVEQEIRRPEGYAVLPIVEEAVETGEGEIAGDPEIRILADRIIEYRWPVRALSGLVAILSEDGREVIGVKDLGPRPVQAAGNVLPLIEEKPPLGEREIYGAPSLTIGEDAVRRVWPVESLPPEEPSLEEQIAELRRELSALKAEGAARA